MKNLSYWIETEKNTTPSLTRFSHLLNLMASQKLFICFVAVIYPSLRRTLVRRNNGKITRLSYEAFYNAIWDFGFLRVHHI